MRYADKAYYDKNPISGLSLDYPVSKHADRLSRVPRLRDNHWLNGFNMWIAPNFMVSGKGKDNVAWDLRHEANTALRSGGFVVKDHEAKPFEVFVKIPKKLNVRDRYELLKKFHDIVKPFVERSFSDRGTNKRKQDVLKDTQKHVLKWIQNNKDKHSFF